MEIKIADQNAIRKTDEIEEYLKAGNKIALFDYMYTESLKGDGVGNLDSTISIIKDYPENIYLLYGTPQTIIITSESTKPPREELINQDATSHIEEMFHNIREKREITVNNSMEANGFFNEKIINAKEEIDGLRTIKSLFTNEELLQYHQWDGINKDSLMEKIGGLALYNTYNISRAKGYNTPVNEYMSWNFIFRYSIGRIIILLKWIKNARFSTETEQCKALLNEIFDVTYATYGTYFDGIISRDKQVNTTYYKMMDILAFFPSILKGDE